MFDNISNNKITPISPRRGKKFPFCLFSLESMLADNPHNLTADEITEWEENRIEKHKAPITERAWKRNNRVLGDLIRQGLKQAEVLDRLLAAKWQGLEVSYFDKEIKAINPVQNKYPTPDERAANEQKTRALEAKAAAEKRQEIEAAKGVKSRFSSMFNAKEQRELQEADRKRLGLSVTEYHEQIVLKNKAPMPKDSLQSGD